MTGRDLRTSRVFSPLPPGEGRGEGDAFLEPDAEATQVLGHESAACVDVRHVTLTPALSRREREKYAGRHSRCPSPHITIGPIADESSHRQRRFLLSPREIYQGRNVFILGSTGFLGKVMLSMLLHRFPEIRPGVRDGAAGDGTSSEKRFWENVVPSRTFDPCARSSAMRTVCTSSWPRRFASSMAISRGQPGPDRGASAAVAADISVVINTSGR